MARAASSRNGVSARLAAAPEPYGLTTATCPSRAMPTAPATPEPVKSASSTGSNAVSGTRRNSTSTRSSPSSERNHTCPSRTATSARSARS